MGEEPEAKGPVGLGLTHDPQVEVNIYLRLGMTIIYVTSKLSFNNTS